MTYKLEIKDEARVKLRTLPEDVRRALGFRIHLLQDSRDLNGAIGRNAGKPGVPWEEICQEFNWDFAGDLSNENREG